jgi:WD repeat-containing protein 45
MIESEHSILSINFNQDQGCFACSTERGFKIFNTYPLKDTFQRGEETL